MANESVDMTGTNPFQLLAFVLFKVRQSLEEVPPRRAPRWVRIVRAHESQSSIGVIGDAVGTVIGGFMSAMSVVVRLTLELKGLLVQTDAAKALVEVTADLVAAVVSKEFQDGVNALIGKPPASDDPLSSVGEAIEKIKGYLGYIPDPDDIDGIGHELYRLLCVVQWALPTKIEGGKVVVDETKIGERVVDHIDIDQTGKLRLMQWAFKKKWNVRMLGTKDNRGKDSREIQLLGVRRLWQTTSDKLPKRSAQVRTQDDMEDTIFDFSFDAPPTDPNATTDLQDVHNVLEALGYVDPAITDKNTFSDNLSKRLRVFQKINGLPVTGRLDNETLARLMNMDFEHQNLLLAKPFDPNVDLAGLDAAQADAFKLVNGDADEPEAEGIEVKTSPAGYPYYTAGVLLLGAESATLPKGAGWISEPDPGVAPGFVALKSRAMKKNLDPKTAHRVERYEGDADSEGEASSGAFFFAARHVEPWKAGRNGLPGADALKKELGVADARARLYQWLKIDHLLAIKPDGVDLVITATANVRTLYKPEEARLVSDQARIGLEAYKDDVFKGPGSRRSLAKAAANLYSQWYPKDDDIRVDADESLRRKSKYTWISRYVKRFVVPDGSKAVAVVLEGRHQSGYDTDAFFDTVRVRWEFVKAS